MYRRPLDTASFRPKWPQTSFWSFQATRNGRKPLFGRFGRPEMAANHFLVVSGDPKWLQTTFWSFRATRNGRKLLFGRFRRKDAIPNLLRIFSKDGLRGGEGLRPLDIARDFLPPAAAWATYYAGQIICVLDHVIPRH